MQNRDEAPAPLIVGFSGHRSLSHPDRVQSALRHLLDRLEQQATHLLGISSAAFGADTLFAEEMLRRGRPIVIVLPFPVAEFERDFAEQPEAWPRARAVIDGATEVHVVSASDLGGRTRDDAYVDAGLRTVNDCDVLIAVWDRQPTKGPGGTGDVVAYARSIGRPIVVIDPDNGNIAHQDLERLRTLVAKEPHE
jgi:hypothetical protein